MPIRLQKIDEHTRPDHSYLDKGDECYYLLEYAPRQGYEHSSSNDLIINLKKPVSRRGLPEYRYKEQAIRQAGDMMRAVLPQEFVAQATWIPIPSSKTVEHPDYDDQVVQVLRLLTQDATCEISELIIQTESLESFHDGCRLNPEQLAYYYRLNEILSATITPAVFAVFDDMLTTGSHFKAVKSLLQNHWPRVPAVGIFIARRYLPVTLNPIDI